MKRLLLLIVSVIVALCIAEIALRIVLPQDNKYYIWQPNLQHTFHPDSTILLGVSGNKQFTINSTGARGDVFTASSKNYVCLGGSATECLYLDDNETWHKLLQQQLGNGYAISSLGKSGVTTREHYLHAKYTVKHLNNVNGIILMVGINDLMKRLSRDTLFEGNFQFTKAVEDSMLNTIFLKPANSAGKVWYRRTALFALLQKVYHKYKSKGVEWQNAQDDKGHTNWLWQENRYNAIRLTDTLPDLKQALDEYESNLQLIYGQAKEQGLELICISQPAMYKDSMTDIETGLLWMGGIGAFQTEKGHVYYSAKALRQGMDMYNERMKTFCARNGIHFLDAGAALPRDTSMFYDDCHFNENGARLLAKYLAQAWPYR